MPLILPKERGCRNPGGADPLVRAGRPRPAAGTLYYAGRQSDVYLPFAFDAVCVCGWSTVSESAMAAQLVPAAEIHWS